MKRITLPSFSSHHYRLISALIVSWLLLCALSGLLFAFGPSTIPFWFSLVVPQEQLAESWMVVSLPALGGIVLVISLWFGRRTSLEHDDYLASVSLWSGFFILLLLLFALLRILKVIL